VTAWRRLAELADQYLAKGRQAFIEGSLIQREWTDRDGVTKYSLDVTATDIKFVGARGDEAQPMKAAVGGTQVRPEPEPTAAPVTDEDIPF
jgi:single-strand DNA-binding protein